MTEPLLPLSDEDLSAYLDDEVSAEVRARIEADPDALAEVRSLALARDLVAGSQPPPLAPDVVDSMISRALDGLDPSTESAGAPDSADDAPLAPPTAIGRRRRGRSSTSTTWMVAAAVVALVAIGLGMVWSGVQSTETSDTAGTADTVASEAERQAARQEADASEGEASDAAGGVFEEPPAASLRPAEVVDLGTFTTGAELRRSLAQGFPAGSDTVTADQVEGDTADDSATITVGQVDSCIQQLGLRHEPDAEVVDVGVATLSEQHYLVFDLALAEAHEAGDHLVAVVAVDHGCSPLITFYR